MVFAGSVAAAARAADGIGLALAQAAVRRGMAVAISDIGADAAEAARLSLTATGGQALTARAMEQLMCNHVISGSAMGAGEAARQTFDAGDRGTRIP